MELVISTIVKIKNLKPNGIKAFKVNYYDYFSFSNNKITIYWNYSNGKEIVF
jgi:hypothetical protein